MTRIKLKGFDEVDRGLAAMADAVRGDVLLRVAHDAAQPMERAYRDGAPDGSISRDVRTRKLDASPNRASIAVGTKHRLVSIFEFGTRPRRTKGRGEKRKYGPNVYRGRIKAMGFARRAFDMNVREWFRDVGRRLWKEVERAGN